MNIKIKSLGSIFWTMKLQSEIPATQTKVALSAGKHILT